MSLPIMSSELFDTQEFGGSQQGFRDGAHAKTGTRASAAL